MILASGIRLPIDDIRKMMVNSLDIIVQQERFSDGVRRITHITEIRGIYNRDIELHNIFAFIKAGTTSSGEVRGAFKPVIKTYPAFYSDFLKAGLISENVFKEGGAVI